MRSFARSGAGVGPLSKPFLSLVILAGLVLLGPSLSLALTDVSGDQSGVWTLANSPYYVRGNVTVPTGLTLTVEAGVQVLVLVGQGIYVQGTLITQGTSMSSVQFRSVEGIPEAGDWDGIIAYAGSRVDLSYTWISHAGNGGRAGIFSSGGDASYIGWSGGGVSYSLYDGIESRADTMELHNITLSNNGEDGLDIRPVVPPSLDEITANSNTSVAIRVRTNPGSFPATLAGSGNGTNGLYVGGTLGGSEPGSTWTWAANPGFPYVADDVLVTSGHTLEVGEGAVVKFWDAGAEINVYGGGAVHALGTEASPVWFTSLKDDTYGGDTNGDGASTTPSPGDWATMDFYGGSRIVFEDTWLAYGGASGTHNIRSTSGTVASLAWDGGGSLFSAGDGIKVTADSIRLEGLDLTGNMQDGMDLTPTVSPYLDSLTADNNGQVAMQLRSSPGSFPATLMGSGNGTNGLLVTGELGGSDASTIWTWANNPGFPYVVSSLIIPASKTLQVAEGTVVKLWGASSDINVYGGGGIRTLGTDASPVWFTSLKDDFRGGDTNGDGVGSSPVPGDWASIDCYSGSQITFDHTWLAYGGSISSHNISSASGELTSLYWDGGGSLFSGNDGMRVSVVSISLENLLFEGNMDNGFDITPSTPPLFDSLTANSNGQVAMYVRANPGSFPATLAGNGNGTNGLYVVGSLGGSEPGSTWTWGSNPEFPYVVSSFIVPSGDTLELAAGTVVKMPASADLNVYGGAALRALGTSLEPVWITSIKDDEHGGDTNADAGATVPAPGDWRAIDCYGGSSAEFEETWLAYGGWSDTDNLHSASGSMDALNWTGGGSISSASRGMRVTADVIDLKRVRIADNASDGARIGASVSATLDSCDIYDNAGQGVRSDVTSPMIDATDCWWGDATGPYDPTDGNPDYNPGGLGDEVSDWVIYRPWLGSPTANLPPVSFALLTPAAGDTVITDSVFFSWETAPDPNGDPVTYELWVDVSPAFPMPESVLVVSGLTDTTYTHMGSDFDNFTAYYWVVFAHDDQDESRRSTPVYRSFFTEPEDAGVPGTHRDERVLEVYPVGPNPSRSASTLRFSLREAQSVRIEIVDVTGRRVRVLHDGMLPAGSHKIGWNGLNDQGIGAASGVFFYRVIAESGTETRRAVLIR